MSKPKPSRAVRRAAEQRLMIEVVRRRILLELASGRDDTDPALLFQQTATSLLLAIIGGLIDPVRLAHEQLAARGLDTKGQWVGFVVAEQLHRVTR